MQRIKDSTASLTGITLYMQPVQDLTIEGTVSRTQYQFILQDADPGAAGRMGAQAGRQAATAAAVRRCRQRHLRHSGLSVFVDIDRDQAARFGITPATIDNALYDAYGQRIVSTIFTNSNQYRVILEADPSLQTSLESLSDDLSALLGRQRAGAAGGDGQDAAGDRAAAGLPSRPVPVRHRSPSTWRRAPRSATPSTRSSRRRPTSACRSASSPASRARRWRSSRRCPTSCS